MTIGEFQARRIERITEALAHFIETTRPDRLSWEVPGEGGAKGRSVLEQASECVVVNRLFAALLRGETVDAPAARANAPSYTEAETACSDLRASGRELAGAVRSLTNEDMERRFAFWRGPAPGESLVEMGYRNMAYHAGQINFIQTLYGDSEFHVPSTWI